MPTVLPTCPCALTRPGITCLPASETRSAPAGTVTLAAGPAETMRPPRTRIVALSTGARSVPSIRRAPVQAFTPPGDCAGSVLSAAETPERAATATSLQQLIFWRFVQGLVTPGVFAGTVAYIHEVWPASHGGRGMAAYMTGTIAGGFTGRAVAGLVAADVSWSASFVALGAINFAVAVALWRFLPTESVATKTRKHERSSAERSFRDFVLSWQI